MSRSASRGPVAAECSFCGLAPGDAALVTGPGVNICAGCVGFCHSILAERQHEAAAQQRQNAAPQTASGDTDAWFWA